MADQSEDTFSRTTKNELMKDARLSQLLFAGKYIYSKKTNESQFLLM